MLAAWLGEAWLQRGGLGGLQRALVLLAELCERYPEEVHPQAQDGDQSWRVPPIDWLLRRYAELLHAPAADGAGRLRQITLYAWQRLQRQQVASGDSKSAKAALEAAQLQQKLDEALRAEPGAMARKQASLLACQQQLQRLEQWCDRCLGELAPGCQPLRGSSRNGWPCSGVHRHAPASAAARRTATGRGGGRRRRRRGRRGKRPGDARAAGRRPVARRLSATAADRRLPGAHRAAQPGSLPDQARGGMGQQAAERAAGGADQQSDRRCLAYCPKGGLYFYSNI